MQPIVQISQKPALIGINSSPSSLTISQPKAELKIMTTLGEWEIHQPPLDIRIDQSRARAAITGGTYQEMSGRIYSGFEQLWLQGIARRMEQGDRVANFQKPGNTIAKVYGEDWQSIPFPETRGPASMDNVDIQITATPPQIEYHKGSVDINVETHKPEIQYNHGTLEVYMRQWNSVSYTPPKIDALM